MTDETVKTAYDRWCLSLVKTNVCWDQNEGYAFRAGFRAAEALAIPVTGGGIDPVLSRLIENEKANSNSSPRPTGGGEVVEEGLCAEPSPNPSDSSALAYAQRLATVAAEHYGPPEGWKPLPDLMGALSQIDNALTGLSLSEPTVYGSTPKTSTPEAVSALNYAADMVYCNADAEWVLKPDYDPYVILNALAAPTPPAVTRKWLPDEELKRAYVRLDALAYNASEAHGHIPLDSYRDDLRVMLTAYLDLIGAHHDGS